MIDLTNRKSYGTWKEDDSDEDELMRHDNPATKLTYSWKEEICRMPLLNRYGIAFIILLLIGLVLGKLDFARKCSLTWIELRNFVLHGVLFC
jgi:hypothetical protein